MFDIFIFEICFIIKTDALFAYVYTQDTCCQTFTVPAALPYSIK